MRHALLDDGLCPDDGPADLPGDETLAAAPGTVDRLGGGDDPQVGLVDCQRVGVDGGLCGFDPGEQNRLAPGIGSFCWAEGEAYLRDEAVWQRQAQNAGDKGRAAEQEKVPVETTGLLEGVLAGLRRDAAHVLRVVWECVWSVDLALQHY